MTEPTKSIRITPTWKAAARIYITALEDGTREGKEAARAGILEMAGHLDRINKEREQKAREKLKLTSGPDWGQRHVNEENNDG